MTETSDRRSFLGLAIVGLGAIFTAILGVPIVCYFLDPRNRKAPASSFRLLDGVKLDELAKNAPRQGVIRDTRVDGWTLYPNDVLGRVWVVQSGDRPDLSTPAAVEAFNAKPMSEKEKYLHVFTTICPHLGCSVNLDNSGHGFECPCHTAKFRLNGAMISGPQKRGMDTLEWRVDANDPTRIEVAFKEFVASIEEKIAKS